MCTFVLLAILAAPGVAFAQTTGPAVPPGVSPPATFLPPLAVPPPPPGFAARRPLDPEDYRRKNERGYFTGLPLANYDPNTGYGGGARVYYYWNGERNDPLFAYTPYLHRLFLQAFFTSKGLQFHWLDYDVPSIAGSAYRFRSQIIFMRNTDEHHYGLGSQALGPLTFTGSPRQYRSFADYRADLDKVGADGRTFSRYDSYDLTRPIAIFSLERTFLHGLLRPMVGLGFDYYHLDDYTGKRVRAVDAGGNATEAEMAPTRFREDCDRGALVGCEGGLNNFLRLGLSFDTRDFEPDPNRGVFVDAALDVGLRALGARHGWNRFMLAARLYASPAPAWADLVFAIRGTFQVQSRDTPFYAMKLIPYTEDPRNGLGGLRTLRGFSQDRFVGPVMAVVNTELRWTFARFMLLRQRFGLIAVPFVDIGGSHDSLSDLAPRQWRRGQGLALRVSWNLATIVTIDYGRSDEDSGLYINFNHIF